MPADAGDRLRRLRRSRTQPHPDADAWAAPIEAAIGGDGIGAIYQPIVDLRRRSVVGYEALSRFDHPDAPSARPDLWFDAAHRLGLAAELNAACLRHQLSRRSSLPTNNFLAVNLDPDVLDTDAVQGELRDAGSLRGVVIEITEHRPWVWEDLEPLVDEIRRAGARFAVDDAGTGYSGLLRVLQLRPSILKLDRALIAGLDRDEAKASLVELIGHFASRIDTWILAEGVETTGEANRLCDLAVPLAQGYLFGRGDEGWASTDPVVSDALTEFAERNSQTLHRLVDPVATIRLEPDGSVPLTSTWVRGSDRWRAVVDADGQTIGLSDADGNDPRAIVRAAMANVNESPVDLAARLATFDDEPHAPVIIMDNAGRYLGLLTMRRLVQRLAELASDGADHEPSRPFATGVEPPP